MTGWTCPSCGVNYAPSVTECRCSAASVVEREKDAERLRQILDDWQKNQPPVMPAPPLFVPAPWVDPMDYWRKPPRYHLDQWYCRNDVMLTTPVVDTINVDYLQLASLGGRQ